jgi:predicted aspartyl protease
MIHRRARFLRFLTLLMGLALAPGTGAGEKNPPEPPSLSALIAQERYAEGFEAADAQLKANPDDKELALTRARCLFMVGRFGEALEAAKVLLKTVPERLDVQDFKADCLFVSFRPLEAVEVWKPLLEDNRWSGVALKKSAMALMAAGDDEGARKLLEGRMPQLPEASDDLLLLTLRVFEWGTRRLSALEELVRRHPENADYKAELNLAKMMGDRPLSQVVPPRSLPIRIRVKEVYGEPSLEALIEGKRSTQLALDTGSQRMLLNRDTSKKLKLEPLASTLREGWGGVAPEAVSTVFLSSLSLGGLEVRNVLAQINARDSEFWQKKAGYIGLSPFRAFVSLYDRRRGFLEVRPAGTSPRVLLDAPDAPSVPILWSSGLPLVPVTVNGRPGLPFLLDTGAPYTLLDKALAARLGIRANSGKYSNRTGLGVSGAFSYAVAEQVTVEFAGMKSPTALQLAGIRTPAPIAFLTDVPQRFAVPCYGILGRDFLNRFRMVFDGPRGTVTLVRYP